MHLNRYFQTRLALGSDTTLVIVSSRDEAEIEPHFARLWQQIYMFERQFSRFLPGSELSVFNQSAGLKTPVSPDFRELLVTAKQLSKLTDGLYNPFVLPALQRAGYLQSAVPGYEQDAVDDYRDRTVVDAEQLTIGDDWAMIPYGSAIDIGGCGKGYLAELLRPFVQNDVTGYWFSLGGDIAAWGHDEHGQLWEFGIQDAANLECELAWRIRCPEKAFGIATSGTFPRPGQQLNKQANHLIDPRTGKSSDSNIRLATICADSTLIADVMASCAVLLGSRAAPGFLESHDSTSFVLQCQIQKRRRIIRHGSAIVGHATEAKAAPHA